MSDQAATDSQALPDANPPVETGEPDEIKALRREAAQYRTKLREAEKALEAQKTAQEELTRKELEEQGKWKEIAEKTALKMGELEQYKAKAESYESVLSTLVSSQREGLPDYITALLDKMSPVDQLEWIAKHRGELGQNGKTPQPQTFNPVGIPRGAEDDAQRIERLRKSAGYGLTPFGKK